MSTTARPNGHGLGHFEMILTVNYLSILEKQFKKTTQLSTIQLTQTTAHKHKIQLWFCRLLQHSARKQENYSTAPSLHIHIRTASYNSRQYIMNAYLSSFKHKFTDA